MSAIAASPTIRLENTLSHDKDYWFTCELRPGYLYVNVRSDMIDYRRARQYWNEIGVMLERTHCGRLLFEKDVTDELSVTEAFQIASEVASELRGVKVALCDPHAAKENAEFGETVVRNRGLNAATFADIDSAREWLMETGGALPASHFRPLALVPSPGPGRL